MEDEDMEVGREFNSNNKLRHAMLGGQSPYFTIFQIYIPAY